MAVQMTPADDTLLRVKGLKVHFPIMRGILFQRQVAAVKAVDGVDFTVRKGETLGLVGESGSGKTSTGRAIVRLRRPTAGSVVFKGIDLCPLNEDAMRRMRRHLQMIFQDPYASLNPRMMVGTIVGEPLKVHNLAHGKQRAERVRELLSFVTPFFPRLRLAKCSPIPLITGCALRLSSPWGRVSTLITSAPISDRSRLQNGPAITLVRSRTRIPSSGAAMPQQPPRATTVPRGSVD